MATTTKKTTSKAGARKKPTTAKKSAPKAVKKSPATTKARARGATKRSATKTPTALPAAMAQEAFWVSNGEILHTVADLADALREMDEATFRHHVNAEKNDFATWVAAVLQEEACAADLQRAKTIRSTRTAALKCLRNYNL